MDGKVIESDGKTENAQHVLAFDPFTLAALKAHVEQLDQERRELGPDYQDHGVLFCWEDGGSPHPDTITRRFTQFAAVAGLSEVDLHDVAQLRHRGPRCEDRLEGTEQADRPRGPGVHHEAVRTDRPGGRPPGRQYARGADHRRITRIHGGQRNLSVKLSTPCTNHLQKAFLCSRKGLWTW